MSGRAPRVVHRQRRPHPQQFSIEAVFDAVRPHLAPRFDVRVAVSSYPSSGLVPRLRAVLEARRLQGELTHVVGDVHYLDLLLRRRSTVLTVHDTEFLSRHTGVRAALYRWFWLQLPVRRARLVTVPSEATRRDLLAVVHCDPSRVRVVPNPVRPGFTPSAAPVRDRPVVLLLGAWPNKNLLRSAQALQGLDVDVVLVGRPDAAQLETLEGLSVQVRVDLSEAQVAAAYRDCDLLLFPSTREGFGVPILEAQASGRPVVTSDRDPMAEVSGGAACLVDPEDVAAIRAGVVRVLTDPAYRAGLVQAGLHNVERYRPERVAADYADVYDEVLGRSTGRTDLP